MNAILRSLRGFFVSLQLSVVLLVFGMILVFAATLDQVNLGIWAVQEKYFRSFIIYAKAGSVAVAVLQGGYTIGGVLLINLIAAHVYRFSLTARKAGIQLTHAGLIVLLLGELLTGLWQEDYNLRLTEGETRNYAESYRDNELVLIDTTDAQYDEVVAIPEKSLSRHTTLQHPKLPFRVVPKAYYPNSILQRRSPGATPRPGEQVSLATTGIGESIMAAPQPITYRQDERNLPSAYVELAAADRSLGTYLVSTGLEMPQTFEYGGRQWKIALRVKRAYKPYALTLLKFTFDRYAGTEIPKNFSSRIRLKTPDGRDDREVLIYMNNPLRYAGLTFYQSGFERDERTTILQVVRNPSWQMPYIACVLMTLGLCIQFGYHLVGFVGKRRPVTAIKPTSA